MSETSENTQAAVRPSSLTWLGIALFGIGGLLEGSVTGTEYERRFPDAALVGFLLMLAGEGFILVGYNRQLNRAGLPPNTTVFLWATFSALTFTMGWANLRGAIHHLDRSLRDILVLAGVSAGMLGWVFAVVSFGRWPARLSQEQQALHWRMIRPWLIVLAVVSVVAWVGAFTVHLLVTGQA